ncbi:CinA family protein [Brevibacterium renqingii]|uniref:CinA family protein n=1 Tax=Brevibacterium renqingii TaxID=2776916 RepID=UPI001AE0C392
MSSFEEHENSAAQVAERLSEFCTEHSIRVAAAESLTGGRIASHLSAASGSGDWFAGGVVAYSSEVKHRLLKVPRGSVISREAVEAMARSVSDMMDADAVVAASGAGGPEGQDGQEPGTTCLAVIVDGEVETAVHHFSGEPLDILSQAQERALAMLLEALRKRYDGYC